ncbi:hypothetical protein [Plebeiibacterium marinum]|uniref:Uncharacterized protein n=1 Tax=Plebeiibacterium marinum TaxID=2992111 RepID=A0AAE3SKZ0_9BACT|nr:hypothetical protein [Plebeiobacterium marinum]MCW3806020.1 hypothetical protein [Plebeiobacterium marinum]
MDVTIQLRAIKKGDDVILHLKDSEGHEHDKTITTLVNPGSKVTWTLMENSDIIEITGISPKNGSANIFSTPPQPVDGSKDWQAIVCDEQSGKESYNIDFKYKDGKDYRDDPDAEINPPGK